MNYENTWGMYNCYQGKDEELIDPECRAAFFALDPIGKVFECISEQGDIIILRYGKQTFRVMAECYMMVPQPIYNVGDIVEIIDKATTGKILERKWHYKDKEPFYFLEINGKRNKRRYKDFEIRAVAESGS